MDRWLTGTTVVLLWGAFNAILAAVLAGFTAAGLVGGAGPAGALSFVLYGAATTGVFAIALVVWAGKHRRGGSRVPPRPVAAVLLAVAVAVAWLGLPFGAWPAFLALPALLAAIVCELYPRERP